MQIIQVPINKLKPDPNQPRKTFDEDKIEELAQSIKTTGVINPIEIDKNFFIITGEYRWKAANKAGLKQIDCKILEIGKDERFMRQMIENVQHTEMTPWEIAQAIKKLIQTVRPANSYGRGHIDDTGIRGLAKKIGKSPAFIEEHLELLKSSENLKKAVRSKKIPLSQIRAITRAPQEYKKEIEKKVLAGEFKTRDGSLAVVEAIKRNPDMAEKILEKDYSKYQTTGEIHEALSPIAPRISDIINQTFDPPIKLKEILLQLSKWLDENNQNSVGIFHLKSIISDLIMAKSEIEEWLSKSSQKVKQLK